MTLFTRNNLEKKSGVFHTKPALTGTPNLVEVQPVVHGNQGCDLHANQVCLHGIRPYLSILGSLRLGCGPARCTLPLYCTAVSHQTETYRAFEQNGNICQDHMPYSGCIYVADVFGSCLRSCSNHFWVNKLGFKARFEPVSRAHGLTRLPLLFSEIKAHGCHNLFQQSLSWHVLLYDITQ